MRKNYISAILAVIIIFSGAVCMSMQKEITTPQNPLDSYFDQYISENFYEQIKSGSFNRNLYPKFSDRKTWENARKNKYAAEMIKKADEILNENIPQLVFSEYIRFATEGNRICYQDPYFARRQNLSFLTIALCLTGNKEKYMPKILDYTIAVMEEFTWVIPAHAFWKGDDFKFLADVQNTDLFASATGSMMAIIYHLLGEEFDKEIENFSSKIRKITLERTVYNIFYDPSPGKKYKMWWFYPETVKNNWTPWCSYNNVITAVLLEEDTKKLESFIRRFIQINAYFVAKYGDDGYCSEGPSYYYVSGLKLFEMFNVLNKICPKSMEKVFAAPKHRAIFEYITKIRIGKQYHANYGDSHAIFDPKVDGIAVCGKVIKSAPLLATAAGRNAKWDNNGQYLDTCLNILFDMPENIEAEKSAEQPFSYFKDRMAIWRSDKFSAVMKGGSNNEPHNHNDLGHFSIFYNNEPVIIDAGTEVYSKTNFSPRRYTLWYTRGSGHNAPVFGGIEQLPGADYTVVFPVASPEKLVCDLSKAYPPEAGVKKFDRTLSYSPEKIILIDDFELKKSLEAQIKLLSVVKPEKLDDRNLKIGEAVMQLDGIEFVTINTLPKMNGGWNCVVYEIILKSKNNNYKMSFEKIINK